MLFIFLFFLLMFCRSVKDVEDQEAQSAVIMASMMTGVGLGNAGVHLP